MVKVAPSIFLGIDMNHLGNCKKIIKYTNTKIKTNPMFLINKAKGGIYLTSSNRDCIPLHKSR